MYVDLADKLISHILEFWKLRQDTKKDVFENSIAMLFVEFEQIHAQYLVAFRDYRELLSDKSCDFTKLIDKIYEERAFSQSNRTKLIELSNALYENKNDDFGHFYELLLNYLTVSHGVKESLDQRNMALSQRWLRTVMELMRAMNASNLATSDIDWELIRSVSLLRLLNEKRFDMYLKNSKLDKHEIAIRILDVIVESMQREYKQICQDYARLRVKYLH